MYRPVDIPKASTLQFPRDCKQALEIALKIHLSVPCSLLNTRQASTSYFFIRKKNAGGNGVYPSFSAQLPQSESDCNTRRH